MEEPGRDHLVLNETERRVLQELGRIESAAPNPRLARAYRRMVELARSDDELDGILAAHVARELLSVLPGIIGITVPSERVDYPSRIGIIAASWPANSRADQAPPRTSRLLRELLEDHEAASTRAREGSRGVMAWADPARAPYVPETSLDRWAELAKSGSGLAHRLRIAARELPAADTCRRHVDEVSALLFAIFAPYLAGIDEVDRLLETEDPTPETARALAALLTTPARYAYVFERIDARWLVPLSSIARLLTIPPRLIERGDGYVQAPPWQQGRFLARVAASEPGAVEALVMQVPATDNPLAILGLAQIAQALPADAAARLVPSLASRMPVSLAIEYAALDAGRLVVQLAEAGHAVEATELLAATVDAALRSRRDDHWHLEQLLDAPVTALAPRSEALGETLRARLRRCLRSRSGRHSTLWLRDIDRRPRYGLDAVWLVANALYRALVTGPIEPSKAVISTLLHDTKPVMRRTALAALADRPDLTDAPDDLLKDPQGWDDRSSTRSEYRRALGGLWELASDDARRSLLEYAESAAEAHEIIARSSEPEGQPEALIRMWRSHLLFAVRDRLPQEWRERCGPLEDVGDNRGAEPIATWIGPIGPVSEDELERLPAEAMLALLHEWQPPVPHPFDGPSLEGLGRTSAKAIVARFAEFQDAGIAVAELRPDLLVAITSEVRLGLRDERIADRQAGVRFVLDVAGQLIPPRGGVDTGAVGESRRHVADVITHAANEDYLDPAEADRILDVLGHLLDDPDPAPDVGSGDASDFSDPGMLALNNVRGEATTASIELLLWARRHESPSLVDAISTALRRAASEDFSLSARAAFGIRLPWLLAQDRDYRDEWIRLLFGEHVPDPARAATWEGYLLYSRYFSDVAPLLAAQYASAVATLEPRQDDQRGRPHDHEESLGIHVALAHLLGLAQEREGAWLDTFFARTAPWLRGRVLRWVATQAADSDAEEAVRSRARGFLERRIDVADPPEDLDELKAVGWIASALEAPEEVLERIVVPALEKTSGETDNETGLVELTLRTSASLPRSSARALELLVDGDPWHSLPHVAGDNLRQCLVTLLASQDGETRATAVRVIHVLGAQGFLEFRDLLDVGEEDSDSRDA